MTSRIPTVHEGARKDLSHALQRDVGMTLWEFDSRVARVNAELGGDAGWEFFNTVVDQVDSPKGIMMNYGATGGVDGAGGIDTVLRYGD